MDNSFLYVRLADQILAYIEQKKIRAGERIPSERALAELFGTSRTSLREAVRILENKGILEVRIGNGMFLKRRPVADPAADMYRIELWRMDYAELLEVKKVLDLAVIDELCGYMPPEAVEPVEEALREMEQSYQEGHFSHPSDALFHRRMKSCVRNATMVQILDDLTQKLDAYALQSSGFDKYWYETVPYHRRMWDAVLAHDADTAREAYLNIYRIDREALRI